MSCSETILRRFADAEIDVWHGDLLLFRRRGPDAIAVAGRGPYTHAAIAGWWESDLMCLELREWFGGRAVLLASQLAPQGIDVFRPPCDEVAARATVVAMRAKMGKRYGWSKVFAAALLHLPVARWFVQPHASCDADRPTSLPEFCSEAVANAYHQGYRRDPVPQLSDRLTEPNDLARTSFFDYQFTLTP